MKVVYLHQYFNTPSMPGGTRSYELARRLVSMGHEVHMVTSSRAADGRRASFATRESGMTVHWLPVPYANHMGFLKRLRAFTTFAIRSAAYATRLEGDVVFASSTPLTIAIPGLVASRLRRRPMVFEVRDLWPDVPIALGAVTNPLAIWLARTLERMAYHGASRVVTLAPGMAQHVVERGVAASRVHVIPNGCDFDLFNCDTATTQAAMLIDRHSWLENLDGPLLVYLGAVGEVNGVDFIVRTMHEVRRLGTRATLVVLGDGKERTTVEQLARDLGLHGNAVRFAGSVPKQEIPGWLSLSSGSFVTIDGPPILYRHGVLNKFFDTIAAGRPVIANFDGFASAIALDSGAAVILSGDSASAAAELASLLANNERIRDMGRAARRLAEARFDRDSQARELETVLNEALCERAGRPSQFGSSR